MPQLAFDVSPRGLPGFGLRRGLPFAPGEDRVQVATALHEAGHCAAALLSGWTVGELGIAIDGSGVTARERPSTTIVSALDRATVSVAGLCANQIAGTVKPLASYRADLRKVLKLANDAGMSDDEAYLFYGQACGRARTLLKQHWAGVLGLANKLLERRTLFGDEISQTFKEAIRCSP
jgi:Peptidase M50B-like